MKAPLLSLSPIAIAMLGLMACSPATETSQTAKQPAPAIETETQTDSARVNAFFERTFEEDLKSSPMFQSYLGIKWE